MAIIELDIADGSLESLLKEHLKKYESISDELMMNICKDLTFGIISIHNKKAIHRDIKTDNILYTKNK